MPGLLIDIPKNGTSVYRAATHVVNTEVSQRVVLVITDAAGWQELVPMDLLEAVVTEAVVTTFGIVDRSGTSLNAEPLAPGDLEFWLEKQAFGIIPNDRLAQYEGTFVASKEGTIVDSDAELEALTDRFFTRFGDVPVYMTRIGQEPELRVDTPFFE